jgi:hypothetical protein
MPAEVAVASHDDSIHSLVALGAQIDIPTQVAIANSWNNNGFLSLSDWCNVAVRNTQNILAPADVSKSLAPSDSCALPTPGGHDTWAAYVASLRKVLSYMKQDQSSESSSGSDLRLDEAKAFSRYIEEVQSLLKASKAKSWNELFPENLAGDSPGSNLLDDHPKAVTTATRPGYRILAGKNGSALIAVHLLPLYDELFEACWIGDNQRIRELCLPSESSTQPQDLLQITVNAVEDVDSYCEFGNHI